MNTYKIIYYEKTGNYKLIAMVGDLEMISFPISDLVASRFERFVQIETR